MDGRIRPSFSRILSQVLYTYGAGRERLIFYRWGTAGRPYGLECGSAEDQRAHRCYPARRRAVSVSGVIGFVGLVVPHMIRLITGSDYRVIVPLSALGGAVFMVWCDTAARSVLAPTEIPLGVVTAFIGAPFFAYLLYRNKKAQGGFIMITAQGLGKAYGKVPILEGVDLHIAEGEWWGSSVRTEAVNPPSCAVIRCGESHDRKRDPSGQGAWTLYPKGACTDRGGASAGRA